jgi:glycosyltransferase involved in cell wall biosynthesis
VTRKIAFIQKGIVPLASQQVARALQHNFPQLEVEIIDMKALLAHRKEIELINLFYTMKEYGGDISMGKKHLRESFFRTPYLFKKIKSLMAEKLNSPEYLFSFQMQSLYDASYLGLPHFVYTDHTNLANLMYPIQDHSRLFSSAWVRLEQTIYQNACHIFTRSHNITHSLVDQYKCDPGKITCVYAGSNTQFDHSLPDNDGYGNKHILFVGVDWERKGGPELVAAFRQVLTVHPDARLTIVGCKPQIDVPNCDVIGRVPLAEVEKYYCRASIFCLPTRLEPFGIVFLEAFAHKLPVVATRIGAIPDFVIPGESGYLVEPGEIDGLAQALNQLLGDPEKCRTWGRKGYEIVQENYTWEKVGQRLHETISMALSVRRVVA